MFICHCETVTRQTVDAAIDDGARSIEGISMRCAAGMRCRGCWPALAELLEAAGHPVDLHARARALASLV